jgi:hypothetical protein
MKFHLPLTPLPSPWRTILIALMSCGLLIAADTEFDESNERTRLYEAPDPKSPGGIQGRVVSPAKPIQQVLAIPPDAPEKVYAGEISGEKRDTFRFTGLPIRKYDLVVIYEDAIHEGLQLHRGESTLAEEDFVKVKTIIDKSEPFFTKKIIHRLEGETGRGNLSRCITTFVREKPSITYMDAKNAVKSQSGYFRHTYKLVILKDVGPGWQIVRARDLYPKWIDPKKKLPQHFYESSLSRVRVADGTKDVGDLNLQAGDTSSTAQNP